MVLYKVGKHISKQTSSGLPGQWTRWTRTISVVVALGLSACAVPFHQDLYKAATQTVAPAASPTVAVAAQSGSVAAGAAGSVNFAVTTTNIADGTAGTVSWFTSSAATTATSAPTAITPSVSAVASNAALITMTATASALAGTYYFEVSVGTAVSAVAALTVSAAGTQTVSVAAQVGTITSGTAGSATFPVTTGNIANGASGTVNWFTSAAGTTGTTVPTGITPSVSAVATNASSVTMTATAAAVPGTYYFEVTFGSATSAVATLTVGCSVTYNGNGNDAGSVPTDSISYSIGATVTVLSPGSLSLASEVFDGWNTAAGGTGTAYNPGDTFTITGNGTLYAIWLSATPTTLPVAQTVTVPSGVTNLTVTSGTNNMFSTTGIVTTTWPTTIVLPTTLISLGYLAFHDCYGLTSITIPSTVTSLGYGVFLGDSNVTVKMTSATPPTDGGAFDTAGTTALVILVPIANLSAYQTAFPTYATSNQIVGY